MTYLYKPYTAVPSTSDKNFININKGGYAHCIKRNSAGYTLPNCFHGDTEFITKEGIKTLAECVDKEVEVLTEDGTFRKAEVKSFGIQPLMKLRLSNGSTYLVTANHRWIVDRTNRFGDVVEHGERTTIELNSHTYIPFVTAQAERGIDADGVRNGFIYGDGSLYNERKYSRAALCGDKKEYMWEYFKDAPHYCENANGTIECYPYPKEYKGIPSLDAPAPYLRGFIVGYLAADGHVDKKGVCHISSAKLDDLKKIKDICSIIGIRTSEITMELRKGFGEEDTALYRIYIFRGSLSPDMILNPVHRQRFEKFPVKAINYVSKKDLVATDMEEEVFCVVEPVTHTFVLADNVLTGNCVAMAHGMWLKVITDAKGLDEAKRVESLMCRNNAEVYWDYDDGFERGQTPKLNALMIWRGNGSLAGHIMVVTEIKDNGEVIATGSNYSGSKFYTKRYYKANGYNFSSSYTFLGFKYCPYEFVYNCGTPVARNSKVDQIEVIATTLNVRPSASTKGYSEGYCNPGIYTVLDSFNDGTYVWYRIGTDMWVANNKAETWCHFLPKAEPKYQMTLSGINSAQKAEIEKFCKTNSISFSAKEL